MGMFPADSESRRTDSRACAIVHYQFDSDHWVYRQLTGADVGCDCEFELSEDNRWLGHKIECQIKGTRHVDNYFLKDMRAISYPLEIKTINYGLGKPNAFVLLVVDVESERIYYQNLHEFFIHQPELIDKLSGKQATLNIRIPAENVLSEDDSILRDYARSTYAGGPTTKLRMVEDE